MNYDTKKKAIIGSVLAVSVLVSFICILVLANTGSGDILVPDTIPPLATTPTIGTTPTHQSEQTDKPSQTPTQVNTNPAYTGQTYGTNKDDNTMSVTSPPPVVTEAPPHVNPYLNTSAEVKLVSFTGTRAKYSIKLNFNKSGTVKLIAIDSARKLKDNIMAENIRNIVKDGDTASLLSTSQSYASMYVAANTDTVFEISAKADEKFDLFIISDGADEADLYVGKPIFYGSLGSVPKIQGNASAIYNSESDSIDVQLTTTIDTTVRIRFTRNGNIIDTIDVSTSSLVASVKIPNKGDNSYNNCSLQASILYNGIEGTERYVLVETLVLPDIVDGAGE